MFISHSCQKNADSPTIQLTDVTQLTNKNQDFGWKMFQAEHKAKPNENILISPFSIQIALLMAQNGAQGTTLNEIMNTVACTNCDLTSVNEQAKSLSSILSDKSGSPKFSVANGFFYDPKRLMLNPAFMQALATYYQCSEISTDFNQEQNALQTINGWVKDNTNQKIDKILDRVKAEDVAFIINALHFKADWLDGFPVEKTYEGPFTTSNGEQKMVQYVNDYRNFQVSQNAQYNLVDLPFKDTTYSLSLIQASHTNNDINWHTTIHAGILKPMYDQLKSEEVDIQFPKLKLAYEHDIIESLKLLGINAAFYEHSADFKKLGSSPSGKNLFVNQIKHKAVLDVDEKGAEGAAVTSIGIGVTSVPTPIIFNKPFVIALRHISTNTLIFTGYVADPTK